MSVPTRTIDPTPDLASTLLASAEPDRLRQWYRAAFGVEPDADGWFTFGHHGILIDSRDDIAPTPVEPGRTVLNFHVPDARAAAERVDRAGTTWLVPLEDRGPGIFGTFTDPDGNYLQLLQMSAEYTAEASAIRRARMGRTAPFSGISVDDIVAAEKFYAGVLGFDVVKENGMLAIWTGPDTFVLAYPKSDHRPATFTVLNIPVDDVEAAVQGLTAQGVVFEKYQDPPTDESGIMRGEGPPIAWFTDPAGNVLSVIQLQGDS